MALVMDLFELVRNLFDAIVVAMADYCCSAAALDVRCALLSPSSSRSPFFFSSVLLCLSVSDNFVMRIVRHVVEHGQERNCCAFCVV